MRMDQVNADQKIYYPDSNRIGCFSILFEVLHDGARRPMLNALFGLCIPIKTEADESGRGTKYYCHSELFDELREGEEIPKYRLEACPAGLWPFTDPVLEARRKDNAGWSFAAVRNTIVRVPPAQLGFAIRKPGQLH